MSNNDTPTTRTAPTTERIERRIAYASQFRQRVDAQGRPIGKRATFTYDPDTGRLVSVTTPPPEDVA